MEIRSEIIAFVQRKLLAGNNSSYFSETAIEAAINDNYILVASMKPWDKKEKGFIFSTTDDYYYDMPVNLATGSTFKLTIDDVVYNKINFEEFLRVKDENTSTEKYFAEYGRQFFVYPATTVGTDNGTIWGVIQAAALTDDSDPTIFSYSEAQLNMAIGELTYADLIQPINSGEADKAQTRAKLIIDQTWQKMADRSQREAMVDRPMFEITDFYI